MVGDRQQTSDDLSHLTQQLRTAARELAPTQPSASGKLRGALAGMDENDLGNRLQRSSDGLRNGEFSDPFETTLTSGYTIGGGGNRNSHGYGALGLGQTHIPGTPATPQQVPIRQMQHQIDQGLDLLNQVRAAVQASPRASRKWNLSSTKCASSIPAVSP